MNTSGSNYGYDNNGMPCNYVDETGMGWGYIERREEIDRWVEALNDDVTITGVPLR